MASQMSKSTSVNKDILAPRKKKASRRRGCTKDGSKIQVPAPFSQSTEHLVHIPVRDMTSWVHRSIAIRRQEVVNRNGKVTKPMNSFFLYRQAYIARAKEWLEKDNQKILSIAFGQSWEMEPQEIRDTYGLLASIDKKNHIEAHPKWSVRNMDIRGCENDTNGCTISSGLAGVQYPLMETSVFECLRGSYNSAGTACHTTPVAFDTYTPEVPVSCEQVWWPIPSICVECDLNEKAILNGVQYEFGSVHETPGALCLCTLPPQFSGLVSDIGTWERQSLELSDQLSYSAIEHSTKPTLLYSVQKSQTDSYHALGFPPLTSADFYQPTNTPLLDFLQDGEPPISDSDADMEQVNCCSTDGAFNI